MPKLQQKKVQIVSENRVASFVRWLVQEEETGSPLMLAEKSFSHRGHSYCEGGFGISKNPICLRSTICQKEPTCMLARMFAHQEEGVVPRWSCQVALKWIWQFLLMLFSQLSGWVRCLLIGQKPKILRAPSQLSSHWQPHNWSQCKIFALLMASKTTEW